VSFWGSISSMISVLVAGIGGASLGTEIVKALRLAGGYRILGCDVSPLAFGHYAELCDETLLLPRESYTQNLLEIARSRSIQVVIPGADETMKLIAGASQEFLRAGVQLAMNAPDVVHRLADKDKCFLELERFNIKIPRTVAVKDAGVLQSVPYPCIIKPSTDSGGSAFVFFARDRAEAALYSAYLKANGKSVVAQEYIPHTFGEFTVGVLSDPFGQVIDAIALKREFPAKLSVQARGEDFLISSGITQGHIGYYPDVCAKAREIAVAVGSVGPMNIQGRIDSLGHFLPFEINPRFSASTYLRALAGFNEVDHFIRNLLGRSQTQPLKVRAGWYLRSLTEVVVPEGALVS
jgi:carbamoyl-phosphate synthase large subunit